MKRQVPRHHVLAFGLFSLGLLCLTTTAQKTATDKEFGEMAHKVVTVSAKIKPGDVVVISGGRHAIPLMEALSVEAAKVGGRVGPMLVTSDRVFRSTYLEVPEQYLGQPSPLTEWIKHADVWISAPEIENPQAVFSDVSESRVAKADSSADAFRNALNQSKLRHVEIAIPTRIDAEFVQLDFATYEKMQWDAINADYEQIAKKGNQLRTILQGAKTVKVTSPRGTDFTFSAGDRPVFVNAGMVGQEYAPGTPIFSRTASLPGGNVAVAPIETSANGRVVAPRDVCRPYERLTGSTYKFKDGELVDFKAEGNARCFEELIAPHTGPKDMFSSFQIGLNPTLKVIEDGGDYRPLEAAGMVLIGIGNNEQLGGKNKTNFFWFIPVVNATVEVDGKTVVKDGQLAF